MSTETDQLSADFEALEDSTVSINGTEYPCILGSFTLGDKVQQGGMARDYDGTAYVRSSLFDTEPKCGSTIKVTLGTKERTFILAEKQLTPDNVHWELRLQSPD